MKRALMIVATALLLIVFCLPVALATDDTAAPVLTGISFSSSTYNRGDTMTVYVAATELESGFDLARCDISFGVKNPVEYEPLVDTFGIKLDTVCDGGVQGSVVLDERVGGVFEVINLVLTDNRGNVSTYSDSLENLLHASFTLVSDYVKPDPAERPIVTMYKMSQKTAKPGETVTYTITGSYSTGIVDADLSLNYPGTVWSPKYNINMTPVAGQENTFMGSITISADMYAGYYYPQLYFTTGSGEVIYTYIDNPDFGETRLNVVNASAPLPDLPKFISYSISTHTVNAGEQVTVSLTIDPKYTTQIRGMNAYFTWRGSDTIVYPPGISIELIDQGGGLYIGTSTIPANTRPGEYWLYSFHTYIIKSDYIASFIGNNSDYIMDNGERWLKNGGLTVKSPFTITGTENASILVGESFDAMAGVTVDNVYSGDITDKVTTAGGDIDTSTPGIYLVKYLVSDTIVAGGTSYDVSYTDYRWIGVTEAMPQSAGDPLVITDGTIEVGASSSEASLTQDGEAIAYRNLLTEEGTYTISASASESAGTAGVAYSGNASEAGYYSVLADMPYQTGHSTMLAVSDNCMVEAALNETDAAAADTKSATLMIDRDGPEFSTQCFINSDTNITVQANAQDVAGIGITKWARGEQGVSYFASGGTEFSGSFQADSYGQYTIYARDSLGNESVKVVNVQAVTVPPSVQAKAVFNGCNTVTWGGVSGVSGYQISRSTAPGGGFEVLTETSSKTYTDSATTPKQTYYYIVRAYQVSGGVRIYSTASPAASATSIYSTPEGVMAVMANYNSVSVSWNPVEGASGYKIYRATSPGGTYSIVKTTSSTSCTNTSLKTGTTYYYKVKAYRTESGSKVYGGDSAVTSATPVLSPVTTASAAAYYPTSVKVSWSSVPGRTKYEVWRSATVDGTYTLIGTTTRTYYKNTGLRPFDTYYYKIRVYRSVNGQKVYGGEFSPMASATPTLGNVANVSAAMSSASSVKVSWSSVTGASGYEVWRCDTVDGTYTVIKSTTSRSYTDKNLTPNQTYYYKVVAYRTVSGERVRSAYSSPVSATPYLGPVTNAAAVRSSATKIKLTWSAVSGRTGYEIYRAASLDGEFVSIGTTTNTSYYNSGLTTGVTVYYKILAYKTVNGVRHYSQTLADAAVVSATP